MGAVQEQRARVVHVHVGWVRTQTQISTNHVHVLLVHLFSHKCNKNSEPKLVRSLPTITRKKHQNAPTMLYAQRKTENQTVGVRISVVQRP